MLDKIFSGTKVLEKAMDASWLRNETIAQNIANVNTPGYKRKKVVFEEYLNEYLDNSDFKGYRTDPRHIPIGGDDADNIEMRVEDDASSLSMRLDENNVDMENENVLMAKNAIKYNVLSQKVSGEYKKLLTVISEGRK